MGYIHRKVAVHDVSVGISHSRTNWNTGEKRDTDPVYVIRSVIVIDPVHYAGRLTINIAQIRHFNVHIVSTHKCISIFMVNTFHS